MISYRLHCPGVRCSIPLPGIPQGSDIPNLNVHYANLEPPTSPPVAAGWPIWLTEDGILLRWPEVGSFLLRDGRDVLVDPHEGGDEGTIGLYLTGPVMAVLLQQRGLLVLHASAVSMGGVAVALLAEAGAGKSTLAAALCRRGHAVVTDDVLPISLEGDTPLVAPGIPRLNLWPDAAAAVGCTPRSLALLHARSQKRSWHVPIGVPTTPIPLSALYVLADGGDDAARVERLRPQEALIELVRHSYVAMCAPLLAALGAETHFRRCGELASRVTVRRLWRKRELATLGEVARAVEGDVARITSAHRESRHAF